MQVFSSKNICEVTLLDQTPAFVFVTCHLGGKQNSNVCKAAVFFNLVFTVQRSISPLNGRN